MPTAAIVTIVGELLISTINLKKILEIKSDRERKRKLTETDYS